jgi:hypothetical protein
MKEHEKAWFVKRANGILATLDRLERKALKLSWKQSNRKNLSQT